MYGNNIPAGQKELVAAAASPPVGSTPSSSRPGDPIVTSSSEQPAPQEREPGLQGTGTQPPPSAPPVSASTTSPPRPTPLTSAVEPTAVLRHSQCEPALNMAAAAVTGRGPTPRTAAKERCGCAGGYNGDSSNSGGSAINQDGGTRPFSGGGGESAGTGAERGVNQGKYPDHHGGDASVFPRMLARNAPDFSFARSRFDDDPSELVQLRETRVVCRGLWSWSWWWCSSGLVGEQDTRERRRRQQPSLGPCTN